LGFSSAVTMSRSWQDNYRRLPLWYHTLLSC
jgi:hypothetical protein